MNGLQKQLSRANRMHAIDQSQFDALAIELARIESALAGQHRHIEQVKTHVDAAVSSPKGDSVAVHQQTMCYIKNLEDELVQLQENVKQTEQTRDECLSRVVAQRTKLKGWDKLIDKLRLRLDTERSMTDSVEADDRHLSQFNRGVSQ